MRKRLTLALSAVATMALLALLVAGLLAPAAPAASKYRPVVKAVNPAAAAETGGVTVTITGKYFKLDGKNLVKAVTFGSKAAKRVRVKSATTIKCVAPAGTGTVHVRVATTNGTSKRVAADKFRYIAPASQMALHAGDGQAASAGTAVAVAPSVLVTDAHDNTVAGVHVTFAVASGGGSVTGADAVSDSQGVATVGSWKLGSEAGPNSLTATCAGLTGSPVTFTATGENGILRIQLGAVPVRSYSLAELQALAPFAGFAGIYKGTPIGPDAVTGAKVLDIVADALGTPLQGTQSVEVTNFVPAPGSPYTKTFTWDQLTNLAGSTHFAYYDATTKLAITPTGTLAAILIYDDPAGLVMPADKGPLRFAIGDSVNDNMAFSPSSDSVGTVNQLNVITTPAP
jgi:hypothetical protein